LFVKLQNATDVIREGVASFCKISKALSKNGFKTTRFKFSVL